MSETRSCKLCEVEFEPKTKSIPVVDGRIHYGCYEKMAREVVRDQQSSELNWRG